jgi:hypothetical protein
MPTARPIHGVCLDTDMLWIINPTGKMRPTKSQIETSFQLAISIVSPRLSSDQRIRDHPMKHSPIMHLRVNSIPRSIPFCAVLNLNRSSEILEAVRTK